MNKREYDTNPTSLNKIYRNTHFTTIYFNYKSPDDVIKQMEEIKKIAVNKKIENVQVYVDYEDNYDGEGNGRTYVGASGFRLETDKEYKDRLESLLKTLEKGKKEWKAREDFYNGTGDNSWVDKTSKYKAIIDTL